MPQTDEKPSALKAFLDLAADCIDLGAAILPGAVAQEPLPAQPKKE
jgi:hypothetical protein